MACPPALWISSSPARATPSPSFFTRTLINVAFGRTSPGFRAFKLSLAQVLQRASRITSSFPCPPTTERVPPSIQRIHASLIASRSWLEALGQLTQRRFSSRYSAQRPTFTLHPHFITVSPRRVATTPTQDHLRYRAGASSSLHNLPDSRKLSDRRNHQLPPDHQRSISSAQHRLVRTSAQTHHCGPRQTHHVRINLFEAANGS